MPGGLRSHSLFRSGGQAAHDSTIRVMVLKSLQVGNIADVIAHARLSDVVPVELVPDLCLMRSSAFRIETLYFCPRGGGKPRQGANWHGSNLVDRTHQVVAMDVIAYLRNNSSIILPPRISMFACVKRLVTRLPLQIPERVAGRAKENVAYVISRADDFSQLAACSWQARDRVFTIENSCAYMGECESKAFRSIEGLPNPRPKKRMASRTSRAPQRVDVITRNRERKPKCFVSPFPYDRYVVIKRAEQFD